MALQAAYIDDLSQTLESVLHDPTFASMFPALTAADIIFDRPLDPFTPPKTSIDLFLYDIRENLDLRLNEVTTTRVGDQVITHPAALRLACSYLVTAWPVSGTELALQEQRLLTEVLVVLSHYPIIPSNFLIGSMVGQDPSMPMVALHPDALKNLAEFWSSLGSKLKASLTVTVTISVPIFSDVPGFPVKAQNLGVIQTTPGQPPTTETLLVVGGQVVDPALNGVAGRSRRHPRREFSAGDGAGDHRQQRKLHFLASQRRQLSTARSCSRLQTADSARHHTGVSERLCHHIDAALGRAK